MPKFALRGFPSGPVRIKVAQDEFSDEKTFSLGNATEGGDESVSQGGVTLKANRMVGTAPAGIFFSAIAEGLGVDDPYFDVRYKWSFSDPGHYTRHDTDDLPWDKFYEVDGKVVRAEDGSVPKGTHVKFLGNDKDMAYGPHVCHVFDKPGTYLVTCEVQRPGDSKPITFESPPQIEIVIEDPEPYFVGPATICVSPSGNFAKAPPRALCVKTLAEAISLAGASKADNVRILLQRGETHVTPETREEREPRRGSEFRRLFYGPYGDGDTAPIYGPYNLFTKGVETAVHGLAYEGGYDPSDPWLTKPETQKPVGRDGVGLGNATYSTVWDCQLSGGADLIAIGIEASNVIIGNCLLSDWHNYGIFAGKGLGTSGFCGVWIKQHPDTVIGGGKFEIEIPFYQDHAPFRCSSLGGPVAFNLCDLRSVGSWAGYYQPCLRIGRSPGDEEIPYIEEAVMDRLRGENGGMLGTGNSGTVAYPRKYLWDKVYVVRANEYSPIFIPGVPGLQYRNVIAVIPNTPQIGGGSLNRWIWRTGAHLEEAVDDPLISEYGIRLYNCTLVDLRDSQNFRKTMVLWDEENLADYGEVLIGNNIVWTPNRPDADDASTGDKPLDLTPLWTPTNRGIRYQDDPFAPIYGTAEDAAAYYRPLPGSAAYHSIEADMPVAVDDFFGRIRGASPSRGAIEPFG